MNKENITTSSAKFERPTWEEFWFTLALFYSTRGTCDRLRTACLLVDEHNRLIGAGYNGSLPGEPHCDEAGHFMVEGHCLRTLHAEDNAILHSTKDLTGSAAYILDSTCVNCAKKLFSKGVAKILYTREFSNVEGKNRGQDFIERIAAARGAEFRRVDIDFSSAIQKMYAIMQGPGGRLAGEDPWAETLEQWYNTSERISADSEMLLPTTIRAERLTPSAKMPVRAYPQDAGLDLYAAEEAMIMPGAQATIGTGLRIAVPEGYAGFVWDKSGLASKSRLKTMGGVLDSNYRGELKIILANLGHAPYQVRTGEKIAQLVVKPVALFPVVEEKIEDETERGERGFGSTGLG